MPVQTKTMDALEQLRIYADQFAEIGDAKTAYQNPETKDELIHRYIKVLQYYHYIELNPDKYDMTEALKILSYILIKNESLEPFVDKIIGLKPAVSKTQAGFDQEKVYKVIESLVADVRNMQNWDPKYVSEIEWQLRDYKQKLVQNSAAFSPSVYHSLLDDIDASLSKIARFNDMLTSEGMDDLHRF